MHFVDHIFREYDIRGFVGKELSPEFAKELGRAYASLVYDTIRASEERRPKVAIGWDCRLSSESYALALAEGMRVSGLDVVLTGMGPTPQLYFSIFDESFAKLAKVDSFDGGIQVTGSHNPPDMNGFKILLGKETLSGAAIQDIKRRVHGLSSSALSSGALSSGTLSFSTPSFSTNEKCQVGNVSECCARQSYIEMLINNLQGKLGKRKLKVVVDAGNGVGGLVGPEVLKALGVEVIELFCEPDGNFPNHHPDPTLLKNIQTLIARVQLEQADFGIGWDGDADRIGVVDENGEPIFGDMLLLLYAREIMKEKPSLTVIGDVKCSELLFKDLKKRGARPIMWKTGHSLIKAKLKEEKADLAGEMSGHIFFKHRYYGFDDALYASLRFLELVSNTEKKVSQLLSDLPKMVSTPELRIDCREEIKFKILVEVQKAFPEYLVDPLDGARITFDKGWAIVRASNTQPVLVMRFEAETAELLRKYQTLVETRVAAIRKGLA
jgi:phosphomannomutase/phosphoglucomutase